MKTLTLILTFSCLTILAIHSQTDQSTYEISSYMLDEPDSVLFEVIPYWARMHSILKNSGIQTGIMEVMLPTSGSSNFKMAPLNVTLPPEYLQASRSGSKMEASLSASISVHSIQGPKSMIIQSSMSRKEANTAGTTCERTFLANTNPEQISKSICGFK